MNLISPGNAFAYLKKKIKFQSGSKGSHFKVGRLIFFFYNTAKENSTFFVYCKVWKLKKIKSVKQKLAFFFFIENSKLVLKLKNVGNTIEFLNSKKQKCNFIFLSFLCFRTYYRFYGSAT